MVWHYKRDQNIEICKRLGRVTGINLFKYRQSRTDYIKQSKEIKQNRAVLTIMTKVLFLEKRMGTNLSPLSSKIFQIFPNFLRSSALGHSATREATRISCFLDWILSSTLVLANQTYTKAFKHFIRL